MPGDLLIPATEALLRGWCGPAVRDGRATVVDNGEVWTASGDYETEGWDLIAWSAPTIARGERVEGASIRLDLARTEVQDHVTRVCTGEPGPISLRDHPKFGVCAWLGEHDEPLYVANEAVSAWSNLPVLRGLAEIDRSDCVLANRHVLALIVAQVLGDGRG